MNITKEIGHRFELVPRADVDVLVDAYQELLQATADHGWSRGAQDTARALVGVLEREGQDAAAEAPRGVIHARLERPERNASTGPPDEA